MAHSKEYMLETMTDKIYTMKGALDFAKIKEGHLNIPEDSLKLKADFIRLAYQWIDAIYHSEYEEYRAVRVLCSEEIWERYFKWEDFGEHAEVVLLRSAATKLRKCVVARSRPDFFKKGKINARLKAKTRVKKKQLTST